MPPRAKPSVRLRPTAHTLAKKRLRPTGLTRRP